MIIFDFVNIFSSIFAIVPQQLGFAHAGVPLDRRGHRDVRKARRRTFFVLSMNRLNFTMLLAKFYVLRFVFLSKIKKCLGEVGLRPPLPNGDVVLERFSRYRRHPPYV